VTFPTRKGGHTVVSDVGANVSCKPQHLRDYGIMAAAYAKHVMGCANPKVGLLNVGSEEAKGTDLVEETHKLFADTRGEFQFLGHVEGNDIFEGTVDVVVCEGFAGNVVLKAAEGLYEAFSVTCRTSFGNESRGRRCGHSRASETLGRFKSRMDYAEYGGAPLLGVNGLCMISHGRSDARAIKNALLLAARFTRSRVLDHIHRGLGAA
jgi:glycerol-3-phosphate acyltransferase PlsX